ncbi:hypothetical protein MNEG_12096 [Monoraphidium neglectum]|uniref:3-oxoacyl-[acyl-carrier-protein] reductase n=1 Tax=Monoraphidium neglectum TaxID=145388 RepID=A0A0D2MM32_9CHLO|nr:hypothetical protein MNEG_12096 [Monoraphidium neglectum]KIY95865.1 hypothetical protein MNEG_12096 [Monoraphidium neglectum]|eukprot:XP_013894885.1 hypothetical protein MNEG_12096 [Monoraphidium neglectum]
MAAAKTLAGKVALVTGSTSGIGLAMIRALAAAGADVGLHGFGDAKTIQGIQDQLRGDHGVRVFYSNADLRQPSQIKGLVDGAADKLGGLHILW